MLSIQNGQKGRFLTFINRKAMKRGYWFSELLKTTPGLRPPLHKHGGE